MRTLEEILTGRRRAAFDPLFAEHRRTMFNAKSRAVSEWWERDHPWHRQIKRDPALCFLPNGAIDQLDAWDPKPW